MTVVGIDLGTTYSLVSAFRDGRPVILPNALGEALTASAVSVDDEGSVLVGAAARARAVTAPSRTALEFKRDMGTSRAFELGPHRMTPEALSALVLQSLKRDAEAVLGETVDEAVVTVPAYFGEAQRQATRAAASIAGLRVERIINEPTAAALAYGLHQRDRQLRAVVLDLGGGTFDVTVLEINDGVVEIQSSSGDARLGGSDFDELLTRRIVARIRDAYRADVDGDPVALARVRDAAELAKRRLSGTTATNIALPNLPVGGRMIDVELSLTREEAEDVWQSLLPRLRGPIQRAMTDARVAAEKIDEVLLVGGSSRMPCVSRLAASLFGRLPQRSLPPDEAVAMGAAVQAALKTGDRAVDDMVVTDVAPFTLGVAAAERYGGRQVDGLFTPIIDRGTVIPVSRVKRFFTVGDGQREITIQVYQGEHSLCRDNTKLGEYTVTGVPAAPATNEAVDIRFTYDLNGILEVECTILSTGKTASLVVEKTPGRLTAAQIEAARKANARLKMHPRDKLPNTAALARAEALYLELVGPDRESLGRLIAAFKLALEGQDEREIEPLRERLVAVARSGRSSNS